MIIFGSFLDSSLRNQNVVALFFTTLCNKDTRNVPLRVATTNLISKVFLH